MIIAFQGQVFIPCFFVLLYTENSCIWIKSSLTIQIKALKMTFLFVSHFWQCFLEFPG